jgi:hypothetical protein
MHLAATDKSERRPWGSGAVLHLPNGVEGDVNIEPFSWNAGGVSIGSGSDVPQYMEMLSELPWIELSQWGDNAQGAIGWIVQHTIASTPTPGVSPDLHVMVMLHDRGEIVGRGRALGPMASNRALIADNMEELNALWRRFHTVGPLPLGAARGDHGLSGPSSGLSPCPGGREIARAKG